MEIRWPAHAWSFRFDAFVEAHHTEVLAEPSFIVSSG
jgi:hypothetical protein